MYKVIIPDNVRSQIEKFNPQLQQRIFDVLERIKFRPFHFVKRKEGTPYFIARIGEHRAILDIKQKESIILVLKVGHRKNIYD